MQIAHSAFIARNDINASDHSPACICVLRFAWCVVRGAWCVVRCVIIVKPY